MEKTMTEISNILEEDVGTFDRDEAADVMDLIFDLREKQTLFTPELHKTLFLGRVQQNRLAVSDWSFARPVSAMRTVASFVLGVAQG